jgi:ABC-type uncharacterized transport system substrate-binding protein
MIARREFIAAFGGAAAWPLVAQAQGDDPIPHVAVLLAGEEDDPDLRARVAGLRSGLERLGWFEDRNIRITFRYAGGRLDRFQPLAKELVALQPKLILAQTPPVVAAVLRETSAISIVFVDVADPFGPGFIASLARPSGNVTGLATIEASIVGKWLAMLKEIASDLNRVLLLGNPKTSSFDYFHRSAEALRLHLRSSSWRVGLRLKAISSTRSQRLRACRMVVWRSRRIRLRYFIAIS